jgi:signal peptidase II
MKSSKYMPLILISGTVILLDQMVKAIVAETIPLYRFITVIPGFFNLVHTQNPGGAFGILAHQSQGIRTVVFIIFSFFAVGIILLFYKKASVSYPILSWGFALIFGGALGNLIDRIRVGTVTDFLDFYIGDFHWPAFNVADSAISIGVAIFLYHLLLNKVPR